MVVSEIESLLIDLVSDGRITGQINQVGQCIYLQRQSQQQQAQVQMALQQQKSQQSSSSSASARKDAFGTNPAVVNSGNSAEDTKMKAIARWVKQLKGSGQMDHSPHQY